MDEKELLIDIRERIVKLEAEVKSANKANDLKLKAVTEQMEEKIKVANNRIKDLEDSNRWLWRAVAGGIISAAIAFLINYK